MDISNILNRIVKIEHGLIISLMDVKKFFLHTPTNNVLNLL